MTVASSCSPARAASARPPAPPVRRPWPPAPASAPWSSPRTPRTRSATPSGCRSSVRSPSRSTTNLWVHQVDAQRRFERSWGEIQGYLMSVLDAAGVDPITAEELTVIPGAEEVLALLELRNHALSGDVGRDHRRLRAHRGDAAAAGAARGARLVHDPRLRRAAPGRPGAAAGADPGRRRADARGLRLRRDRAAAPRPRAGAADPEREGRRRSAWCSPPSRWWWPRRGGR